MMRVSIAALALVLEFGPAHADDRGRAEQLYQQGLRSYDLAEYPQAIAAWKQAYSLSKKPLLLFNIGQALRLSSDCTQALTFYDSYVREATEIQNEDELDSAVTECKAKLATHPPSSPPQPAAQPAETRATWLRPVGLAVGAAGIAAVGAGVYFAVRSGQLADENEGVTAWSGAAQQRQNNGKRDATLGWGLAAGGAALAIAGGVMFRLGGHPEEPRVTVTPTPGGVAVGWTSHF